MEVRNPEIQISSQYDTCLETKAHMGDSRTEGRVRLKNTLYEKQLKKTWKPDQLYPMWPGQRVELSENRSDLIQRKNTLIMSYTGQA